MSEKNVAFLLKIVNNHIEDSSRQTYKSRKFIQDFDKTIISKVKKTVNWR